WLVAEGEAPRRLDEPTSPLPDPAPPAALLRVAPGSALPDLPLTDLDGRSTSLRAVMAERPGPCALVLWATWCRACARELDSLQELQARNPDARILGLDVDGPDPDALVGAFVRKR